MESPTEAVNGKSISFAPAINFLVLLAYLYKGKKIRVMLTSPQLPRVPATIEQDALSFSFEAQQPQSTGAYNATNACSCEPFSEQIIESLASKTGSENSSAQEQSLDVDTRIPYENGYGDFCFGRLIDRFESLMGEEDVDDSYWRKSSNGIPVPEMDSSQIFGSFPFFKLPRDIRDKIYRLLLGPLYSFDPKTKSSYIEMYLGDDSHEFEPLSGYDSTFDEYLEEQRSLHEILENVDDSHSEVVLSTEQYEAKQQQFYKENEKKLHYMKAHPSRGSPYRLDFVVLRNNAKDWENNHDYILMEWIRQASNVCTKFRAELATIIWSNVRIKTNGGDEDTWFLPQLIYERPAASLGIKSISMEVNMMDLTHLDWDSEEFGSWCADISETLEVDNLDLIIAIEAENLRSLGEFRGNYSGLAAARSLRVTKAFEVNLSIIDTSDDSGSSSERRRRLLEQKYEPIITNFMLPDTLRKSPAEQEKYLESRLVEHPSIPAEEPKSDECTVM